MNCAKKYEEIEFPIGWGKIAGKEWGRRGGKQILAIHGWHENCTSFDPLSAYFPDDWWVIAIDLWGHGKSSHLPQGVLYDYFGYVMQIKRVVDHLGWQEFSFIGHSLGGGIGILFSCIFPNRIRNIISIDFIKLSSKPASDYDLVDSLRKMFNQWDKGEKFLNSKREARSFSLEKAIELMINVTFGSLNEEGAKILLKRGSVPGKNENEVIFTRDFRLGVLAFANFTSELYEQMLRDFTSNLLIIKASNGAKPEEEETGEYFVQVYRRVCPLFELVNVEGTHHVHIIKPEVVAKHAVEFIQKNHVQKELNKSKL